MGKRILLFIPAYNCEKQIGRVLSGMDDEILRYVESCIVVNNRSTDNTEGAVLDFIKSHPGLPVKLLRNRENYGLGGSHKVAFDYALKHEFEYVVVLHGDDQADIHDFSGVFSRELFRKYDCVLGARFMRGSTLEGYSLTRTLGNIVYDFLFAAVMKRRVYDLGSGLNMYSVKMLSDRFYYAFPDDLTFNYCMVLAMDYYKQSCRFYPISWRESDQASNVKLFRQAVRVLDILKSYALSPDFIRSELRQTAREEYLADEVTETDEREETDEMPEADEIKRADGIMGPEEIGRADEIEQIEGLR